MLYSIRWNPYTLMLAESDGGIHWEPLPQPHIKPPGEKKLPITFSRLNREETVPRLQAILRYIEHARIAMGELAPVYRGDGDMIRAAYPAADW
ncbi:hypothetical protein ACFL6S_35005, partial [Candidatus Poribacteria bacterium]